MNNEIEIDETSGNGLERIKSQLEQMKKRLNELDNVLNVQEKAIDLLEDNNNSLAREANMTRKQVSPEVIMRNVFSKGTLPKILQKNQ